MKSNACRRTRNTLVYATAKGYGRASSKSSRHSETNRMELAPFVLKLADRLIAGQVLNDNDKPASGVKSSMTDAAKASRTET